MKTRNPREQGQVIILMVAGIISLLGFTALAIDGARIYSERRHAQGTADTAAFTAAAYIGQYTVPYIQSNWMSGAQIESDAKEAALSRIRSNGYTDPVYDPFGSDDRLDISIEPITNGMSTKYLVKVFFISEVEPVFAQLITDQELLVNVTSHVIVVPRTNIGFGQALVSLSETECNALQFTGGSTVDIDGTGIFANSDCPNSINLTGGTAVDIEEDVITPGDIDIDGGASLTSGGTDTDADQESFYDLQPPDCTGMLDGQKIVGSTTVYKPGVFSKKISISKGDHFFQPGLYCLESGLNITGGNITAHGVTFYIEDGNANANNAVMDFTAPSGALLDSSDYNWSGMLFYIEGDKIDLQPATDSYFEGTIYAPSDKIDPTCKLTGNGDTYGYNLQLVCNTITLAGGAGLVIVFDNTNAHATPVIADLVE
jgi:hypothetical protein